MNTVTPYPVGLDPRLLRTKLTAPAAVGRQIVREPIVEALCTSNARLVLLRAPAGFGKSTVMLQCRERLLAHSIPVAWINVDRADNDASRFVGVLEAAAAVLTDVDEEEARQGGLDDCSTLADAALRVISRLSCHAGPFVLMLDEFEAIQEAGVLGLLRELVDQLPTGGRLVIGSRGMPDLRLGRLRARGQLLEIDAARLRFSQDETARFLEARDVRLAPESLARLHAKTEGWVAALWLASVSMERSASPAEFVERFSGTEHAIADYLAEDVLARQTPPVRDFLLRTSVLRTLEPSLCDALVPGAQSRWILRELETANVLIVPLDAPGTTYRYHSLFARFLEDRLRREAPESVASLHCAAATWYEAQHRPVPAIDHALEGGHTAYAVALLKSHAPVLLAQGRMRLLARWFDSLPDVALAAESELQMVRVWAMCFARGPHVSMALLERSGLQDSRDPLVAPHIRALRPCLLAMLDRYEDAYDAGRESLRHLPSRVPFADNVLANAMATIVAVMGEHEHARRLIDAARRGQGLSASEFNLMYSEAAEGIIDLQEGRLRQAAARFRLAVSATPGRSYSHANGNAWAGIPYAVTLYESNRLDQASHLLQVYLPLARDVGLPDLVILGYRTLSRIAFARGDVDQALQMLIELEYVGHKGPLPRVVAAAKLERARVLLLQGHHRAAREELDRADDPELWSRVGRLRFLANDLDYQELARLRWELHAGDRATCPGRIDAEARRAESGSRYRRALKLRLLHACALYRANETSSALTGLATVLKSTCAEGFVRLVLDEGDILRPLVHALVTQIDRSAAPHDDPLLADHLRNLATALGPMPSTPSVRDTNVPAALVEPLTRKEIRILQLLAEGYSNSAMAEKLFVSDSTIRTHLRNINAKLDTHSRTQAVAMARRLGVIG